MKEKAAKLSDQAYGWHYHAFHRFVAPFKRFLPVFKHANHLGKWALILQLILPGVGLIVVQALKKGILYLLAHALFLYYLISSGFSHLSGTQNVPYLNYQILAFIVIAMYLILYYFAQKAMIELLDNHHPSTSQGSKIWSTFHKLRNSFNSFVGVMGYTYRKHTKQGRFAMLASFVINGYASLRHKQWIAGFTFLLSQIGVFVYMGVFGFSSLKAMIALETMADDRRKALVYGVLTILILVYYFFIYITSIKAMVKVENQAVNQVKIPSAKAEWEALKNDKAYRITLFIPIIGALLFTIIPLLFMILLAFTNYNLARGIGVARFTWTGLASFTTLLQAGNNLRAFVNVLNWTMVWATLATFTCYFGGFLLAMLLAKKTIKWKPVWRSIFVVAMAVPQFVSLRVMNSMFHTYGPINTLLLNLGLIESRINFWADVNMAKTLIIFINMWVGIPYYMLLISGLLLNIPKDYYEAAEIEGAGKLAIFRKITFPYIFFMTTPLLITGFVGNINNFNVIWLLTNGGPSGQGTGGVAGGTDILITWLYKLTMYDLNVAQYDLGAAIGIIMFIISATLSLIIFRRSSAYKKEEEFRK